MKTRMRVLTPVVFILTLSPSAREVSCAELLQEKEQRIPHYFLAIHNEPCHHPGGEQLVARNYGLLRSMIQKADAFGINLTLMFSPQWAQYITASPHRMQEVARWQQTGHEIAAHHHSIVHGNWDGYSAYSREEAESTRCTRGHKPEKYLGTLDDFMSKLHSLDPDVRCGCLNDEGVKRALPDAILYDTCSGFANFGDPGRRLSDAVAEKGKNDYVSTGTVNGITRKWLCHSQTTSLDRVKNAKRVFSTMRSGVYGSVNHSSPREQASFDAWLAFLHEQDPKGTMSRTVSEVIDQRLLPQKEIADAVLNASLPRPVSRNLQGEIRRTVSILKQLLRERKAAGADVTEAEALDRQSREALQRGQAEECLRLLKKAVEKAQRQNLSPPEDKTRPRKKADEESSVFNVRFLSQAARCLPIVIQE